MQIDIEHLAKFESIGAVKVLIAFLAIKRETGTNDIHCSWSDLMTENGLSAREIQKGIKQNIELGFVKVVSLGKGNRKTHYSLNYPPEPEVALPDGYIRATGARRELSKNEEVILELDFDNLDFYVESIDSMSIDNENIRMTNKEINSLAARIVKQYYRPRINRVVETDAKWYAMQIKFCGDLLVRYRTIQVIAAIRYWTEIEECPNGLISLLFLRAKNKKRKDNISVALDHFKAKYISDVQPKIAAEELERKREERLQREKEEVLRREQERQANESLSNEQIVDNFRNRFKHLADKVGKGK